MKPLSFTLTLLFIISILFSQQIDSITNISHENMLFHWDEFSFTVLSYENRLFSATRNSIEEFMIHEDQSLETLAIHEMGAIWGGSIIDENRYYVVYSEHSPNRLYYLKIYDLSAVPMTEITTIPFYIDYVRQIQALGDFIFIGSDEQSSDYPQTLRLNKHTLTFESPIPDLAGLYTIKDDIIIKVRYVYSDPPFQQLINVFIDFYDFDTATPENPYGQLIHSIELVNWSITGLKIQDDYLLATFFDQFIVYDLSDMENITQIVSIVYPERVFIDMIMYEDYLIVGYNIGVLIYDISDVENVHVVYTLNRGIGSFNPMHIKNDRLYVNTGIDMRVYDIQDQFTLLAHYGKASFWYGVYDNNYLMESDILHHFDVQNTHFHHIFEESRDIIIENTEHRFVSDFKIRDEKLYILSTFSNRKVCDIFDISNVANPNLLTQLELVPNMIYQSIRLMGDFVVISSTLLHQPPNTHLVYEIIDNQMSLLGSFTGIIASGREDTDSGYFISYTSDNIIFREVEYPLNILSSMQSPVRIDAMWHIDGNLLCIKQYYSSPSPIIDPEDPDGAHYYFYTFTDDFSDFTMTYHIPHYPVMDISVLNGYMTVNYSQPSPIARFYRFDDGVPVEIGEYNFGKTVRGAYIFPERDKLALMSASGFHMYNIEYTVSESNIVSEPAGNVLHSNYPNPFNPSTTIAFDVARDGYVSIDVYNIKGQRVKEVASGSYRAGRYSVVWNGVDSDGHSVSSGVYFYRMKSQGYSAVKKMLLMK